LHDEIAQVLAIDFRLEIVQGVALDGMLLTKIPVKDPDSLVRLRWAGRNDMVTSSSDYGFVARANGDPASDYLLGQNTFLPFTAKIDNKQVQRLDALLREAQKAGFRTRVAVILNRSDLGTAFSLYGKPQKYADFLDQEISFQTKQPLLVVMAAGYGVQGVDAKTKAAAAALAKPASTIERRALCRPMFVLAKG
jgi:hypothetical protein